MAMVWRSISAMVSFDSERGGSEQAQSPECTPASSICSMMPAMKTSPSLIADRIHIHFGGAVEEAVDQHRIVAGDAEQLARFHLLLQFGLVGHHHHAAPAQHIRGTQDHRIADRLCGRDGFVRRHGGGVARLLQLQFVQQRLEALAVFGQVDGVGAGAQDRHARIAQARWRA